MGRVDEKLPDAIGRLYKAAVHPTLWPDALSACAEVLGAHISTLFLWDVHQGVLVGEVQTGSDDDLFQDYVNHYSADCPWMQKIPWVQSHGRVTLGPEMIPQADFLKTASYQDLYRAMDVTDNCVVPILDGINFGMATFLAGGKKHSYEDGDRTIALIIQRHLTAAVELSSQLHTNQGHAVLAALTFPAVIIDTKRNIIVSNKAYETFLTNENIMNAPLGAADFADNDASSLFHQFLKKIKTLPKAIPYKSAGHHRFAKLVHLPVNFRDPFLLTRATRLLLVFPSELKLDLATVEGLRKIGFTGSEILLIQTFNMTPSVASVASALGWTPQTTRWRLKQVFAKLNLSSQAEFAAALARLSAPVE